MGCRGKPRLGFVLVGLSRGPLGIWMVPKSPRCSAEILPGERAGEGRPHPTYTQILLVTGPSRKGICTAHWVEVALPENPALIKAISRNEAEDRVPRAAPSAKSLCVRVQHTAGKAAVDRT